MLFEGLEPETRLLLLADGRVVKSLGTYGQVLLPELEVYAETFEGVDEIVVRLEFAKEFRVLLDSCSGIGSLEPCVIRSGSKGASELG